MANHARPVVTGPISGGQRGRPFFVPKLDLAPHGYVEEEFFIEGEAVRYRPVAGTTFGRDGRWQVEPAASAPYKTRIVVYRPQDPARFNGTVFVCWTNVSGGCDNISGLYEDILTTGAAVVGISAQKAGVHGAGPQPKGLLAWDPDRYGSLFLPGDDYSFDIFTQGARAVGPDRDRAVDPMHGLEVRKLIANGSSQSAARLATYINAVHPLAHALDGYILQLYFGTGVPIEVGDTVAVLTNDAPPAVLTRGENLIREDLDVPVMVVNSELEAIACNAVRQPDTALFRTWEVTGSSHVAEQYVLQRIEQTNVNFGPDGSAPVPLLPGMNRVPMAIVENAANHYVDIWVNGGPPPPSQPLIEFDGATVVRDERGVARGGVRLPQVLAPLARHDAIPTGPGMLAFLCGTSKPFAASEILAMYGDEAGYMRQFEEASRRAIAAGVLLPCDASWMIEEARQDFRRFTA